MWLKVVTWVLLRAGVRKSSAKLNSAWPEPPVLFRRKALKELETGAVPRDAAGVLGTVMEPQNFCYINSPISQTV